MAKDAIDIENICRACLRSDCNLQSIFTTLHNKIPISQILMNCIPVFIAKGDGLSHKICDTCMLKAVELNEFQQMYLSSDKEMRNFIESKEEYIWKVKLETADNSLDSSYDPNFVMVKEMIDSTSSEEEKSRIRKKTIRKTKTVNPEKSPKKSKIKKLIECKVCFESFISSARLSKHFISSHKQEVSMLGDVEKVIVEKDSTRNVEEFGIDSHHEMNDSLLQNILSHEVPTFLCGVCPKKFYTDKTLQRHQVIHSELMKKSKIDRDPKDFFHCVVCLERIENYQKLFVHMRKEHKSSDESKHYECQLCLPASSKSFKNFSSIVRHAKIHEENATHQCYICSRKMGIGDDLIVHFLRHEGIKPDELASNRRKNVIKSAKSIKSSRLTRDPASKKHLCAECGREFTNTDNFKKHLIR